MIKTKTKYEGDDNKVIVTAALPYANGNIHIGHLLEYIQADVYTRFLKLIGREAYYICASDMHGTPIEVNAAKEGVKPEVFVEKFWSEHQKDFATFLIKFDNYYKTHSSENRLLAEFFFSELKKKDLIYTKKIKVMFCVSCARYLPDRFVKGVCPNCKAEEQYGDICEKCNAVLKAFDLINSFCVICKNKPEQRDSLHYFFKLSQFVDKLQAWMLSEKEMQQEMKNWLQGWIDKGLDDWCISRDAPYFGFEIPGSLQETGQVKYFYVWLDAPIGYISSTQNLMNRMSKRWEDYWHKGRVQHFIGKDISYFHFLFWPAILMAMEIPLPKLMVHGFITVNGQKMSKSRGTYFTAKDFAALYPVEGLRFYYASHLDRKLVDVDLSLEEFKAVNNNVLMGSLGNFCYRVLTFAEKNYGCVDKIADEKNLNREILELVKEIEGDYLAMDFKSVVKGILTIADIGNAYFQRSEVWKCKDSNDAKAKVGWCVNLARNLAILASPILPEFSRKVREVLGEKKWGGIDVGFGWKGELGKVELLVEKVELKNEIVRFPLHMVIGEVKEVEDHPNADSLYLMKVDFGVEKGLKQVVAGLKKFFRLEELVGKRAVFCVNMKPAKLRGEVSEAMIMVADDGEKLGLLQVSSREAGEEVLFEGMVFGGGEIGYEDFKKLKMEVKGKNVVFEGRTLSYGKAAIVVEGVKEGARIA
ncbi:methionine--tRNA ligase [Candidatus Woesearchaeota archaeon]|nr:methionine--tRNA ligase [Candidatus Woesearchaeota archaeon]